MGKNAPAMIDLGGYVEYPDAEMRERAQHFADELQRRRTVRDFAEQAVERKVVEDCLRAATSAPSGANRQPWHFVVVDDPTLRKEIRTGAEAEEEEFYQRRAPQEWLDALAHLGTDEHKPFLEKAPHLIVIMAQSFEPLPDGGKTKNYYVQESVGIATGMLISALHHAGVATLTHTPSPMNFLNKILGRPSHERPYLILVTGYPADDVTVPDITKKPLEEIATFK